MSKAEELQEVSEAWATWIADDIMAEVDEDDLVPPAYIETLREVIIRHLTDVAMANAIRTSPLAGDPTKEEAKT